MLTGNSMRGLFVLIPLLSLVVHIDPRGVEGNTEANNVSQAPVDVKDVRLLGTDLSNFRYGILEVQVGGEWLSVCQDNFDQTDARVFCRQLGYTDGLFQPGFNIDESAKGKEFDFNCLGPEPRISMCITTGPFTCLSEKYVMLFCSTSTIKEKDKLDVQIKGGGYYGELEVDMYGFWGPVCNVGWTDIEADAVCRHLNFKGGVSYYPNSEPDNKSPMVVGGFDCSDSSFNDCPRKSFGEDLGCQYPLSLGARQQSAGVFCFSTEESKIKFRLSDRWYGKVEIQYSEWGRVCNDNWDDTDASVLCKQLGYVDGRLDRKHVQPTPSSGFVRMNNVNCTGDEKSILECEHEAMWTPKSDKDKCNDATVMCNITICGSLDIKNTVDKLQMLENCSIIEGNLTILLINTKSSEDYDKYSFPNLVEITDFLLLFRAHGLKSLSRLFPNLAIIRGDNLFSDYALVAFEMPDLEMLGLPSLVSIPRGAVRLDKNPNLCYIETIDWSKITSNAADNYFRHNKDVKECVNRCHANCPKSTAINTLKVQRCWWHEEDHCQKMLSCPETCKSGVCNGEICCDKNCIGGCTGPSASQCTVCKQVMVRDSTQFPRCAQRCSTGTYMYMNHRCLYDYECLEFRDYLKLSGGDKINNVPGICSADCPRGYNVDPNNEQKCVSCKGPCPKVCEGQNIDSVGAAAELVNCNIIKGPLVINLLRGSEIGQELERSMAHVQEITAYLRITHSYTLLSLHFLKGLQRIGGETLYKDKFAVYINDNLNLQELFTADTNLTIGNGTLHFQYNRKLCYSKIVEFAKSVGIKELDSEEVSIESNGDDIACDIQELNFSVFTTTPHIAFIQYKKINMTDQRRLIGYSINWKEAPVKNASIYKGRDACSDDIWNTREICTELEPRCDNMAYITMLEPWTQYAVYMQAVTVSKAIQGAISKIIYFRTAAEVPTSPTKVLVQSEHPGELRVTWEPPKIPRGNVTHYQVYWQKRDIEPTAYELRDYCTYPLDSFIGRREEDEEVDDKSTSELEPGCCTCPKTEKEIKVAERERNLDIRFQDYLQNAVYVKRLNPAASTLGNHTKTPRPRPRRSLNQPSTAAHEVTKYKYEDTREDPVINITATDTILSTTEVPIEPMDKSKNIYYYADVYENREFIISSLGHFQDYNIEVIACQDRVIDFKKKIMMKCSQEALGFGRTMLDDKADNIDASLVQTTLVTNRTGAIHIRWEDPPSPNGLIITYEIEFMKSNIQNVKPNVVCITYKKFRDEGNKGHIMDNLDAGTYTFRIRATSLAGNGSWTSPLSFNIPDQETDGPTSLVLIVIGVIAVVVVVILTSLFVWFIAKKRFKEEEALVSRNPNYDDSYLVYEPDEWEVARENVKLLSELGQGSFGMVYEGLVTNLITEGEQIRVAVKTTNTNSNDHDRYQFLQEASIMKAFHCHHVVRLIGVVSREQPAYVLMELMPKGDLKNFLRQHRPDEEDNEGKMPPTLKQILQMSGEIADGMAYLADKKYVHRDLAARNCMVGENLTVKIGDFGMTRDIYETDYYRKGSRGLLPVRWMAPESLRDGVFTSMTDVWSYGVVLWEMATLAAQPYQGLSNEEVLRYVGSGKIMDTPERCPPKLYDLMVKCWRYRPKQRPTFKEIIELLLPDLDKNFHDCSYFFSEENAKYEESRQGATANLHDDNFEDIDNDEGEDPQCPIDNYVDEAQLPMLGVGASNGHSVELQDIFSDSGTYPHYSSSHNKQHVGSAEVCDCTNFRDVDDEGAAAQSVLYNRRSVCSSPNSAIGGSSDGSKDSSKSSSSSYAHMNGLSVANGHVPVHMRTTPC